MKFRRYTPEEKKAMVKLYNQSKCYTSVATKFGCASSTIYYAVNPEAYESHRLYVNAVRLESINKARR